MRGLDGNYINMQGDASARIQVAYQAEQNRQQIRAQVEATDALRKLREQVNETEKKTASAGPGTIRDDQGSNPGGSFSEEDAGQASMNQSRDLEEKDGETPPKKQTHIDVRV